jgi:hypothetical protein
MGGDQAINFLFFGSWNDFLIYAAELL